MAVCHGFLGIAPSNHQNHHWPNNARRSCTTKASTSILLSSLSDSAENTSSSNRSSSSSSSTVVVEDSDAKFVEAVPMLSSVTDPEAVRLREELLQLAKDTNKGFTSTPSQKNRAREIIYDLARFNPTKNPAAPYYPNNNNNNNNTTTESVVSLAGKWDLIYTDAPDITSLDTSRNPLATAQLGRIGQECTPPFIKNVIEWRRPDWTDQLPLPLPFIGNKQSRILQKVCTKATANPDQPMLVNLELAGIDLVAPPLDTTSSSSSSSKDQQKSLQDDIEREGLLEALLRNNPLELRGPLTASFGQFEILYLDEELRMIRTNQSFLAVNRRAAREEWF